MAAMHRVMQSELHGKIADENRERWAQWRSELEKREKQGSTLGEQPVVQYNAAEGRVNIGAQLNEEDEGEDGGEVAVNGK